MAGRCTVLSAPTVGLVNIHVLLMCYSRLLWMYMYMLGGHVHVHVHVYVINTQILVKAKRKSNPKAATFYTKIAASGGT